MRLLTDLTADTAGSEPYARINNGGSFMIAIPAAADLGGGSLSIELASLEDVPLASSAELVFNALPEPRVIFLPAGIKVRAQLTGSTAPDIPFLELIPADASDKNRGASRI